MGIYQMLDQLLFILDIESGIFVTCHKTDIQWSCVLLSSCKVVSLSQFRFLYSLNAFGYYFLRIIVKKNVQKIDCYST